MSSVPQRLGRSATVRAPRVSTSRLGEQADNKDVKPRRRTYSNSSGSSAVSSAKSDVETQFAFSPLNRQPGQDRSSFFPPMHSRGPSSLAASVTGSQPSAETSPQLSHRLPHNQSSLQESPDSPPPQTRPIAIQLPSSVSDRPSAKSVYTPIPPLSGRGDLPGGYFPFHENPNKRITRPHPFHTNPRGPEIFENVDGQAHGDQQSSAATHHSSFSRPAVLDSQVSSRPAMSSATMSSMSSSRGNTPVTSYVPSGHQDVPLPLGKYYPSNYEAARSRQTSQQSTPRASRPPSSGASSSLRPDSIVSHNNRSSSSHVRSESDAKRRLQQYQRDMVAQATQAARRHLAGAKGAASLAAAHGVSVRNIQGGSSKPVSPRLQPLGSPGPVTPMELEGQGDGGYLTRGRAVPSPDAERDSTAVARALKTEEERKRREGRASPTVQAGGFGF